MTALVAAAAATVPMLAHARVCVCWRARWSLAGHPRPRACSPVCFCLQPRNVLLQLHGKAWHVHVAVDVCGLRRGHAGTAAAARTCQHPAMLPTRL